jgi:hypothetical protein
MSDTVEDTLARDTEVAELLVGAVDLHCHSGPAAMPRILDHHEALLDCAAAGFRALLYKDHFYLGTPHAIMLEKLFPELGVKLFSGIALNNASGGINPHAVDHAAKIGAKIVWMPTLSAANHIEQALGQGKSFPKTAKKMLDPVLLPWPSACSMWFAAEMIKVFAEARRRGVRRLLVNHPTYLIGCTDDDIRELVSIGAHIEHSICMWVEGKAKKFTPEELVHLIEVAGVSRTILSSDLGLVGSPRPVEGFRQVVRLLLDQQVPKEDIRKLVSLNAARLIGLDEAA